ncbi:MAG TPA: hypothetical protein DF783_00355 [Acidimicrobiaceae bacterium]|mgnify:CR=1 FL=1|nr:hypothetical protein [Acidimicrobiaceae bacterium]HCV35349.1 hypothetical protein [Acidimicrobiaceae bacterium]
MEPDGPACTQCGLDDTSGANFCPSCGTQLMSGDHEATDSFEALPIIPHEDDRARFPSGIGLFVVDSGPKAGSRYGLESEVTSVGRHRSADILLDDVTVSRRHVEVDRTGDRYVVRDIGSLNGTYLNGDRIESAELHDGDELQIGRFKLVFFYGTAT